MKKFLIKVEGLAPIRATYEVMAEDVEQAYQMLDKYPHRLVLREKPFIDMPKMKRHSISIMDMFSGVMEMLRKF